LAVIAFEWLKRIESNSHALWPARISSKSVHPWASAETFSGGGNVALSLIPFQVADDVMQMDVHKTLYCFYPTSLCWLNLNSQSFVWNVFYTSAIRNAFSFHKLPNIHFSSTFCKEVINWEKSTARTTWAVKKQGS